MVHVLNFFFQLSYLGTLFLNRTNQSMCFKGRVEKSHVKLKALQFLPWSGKSNRMINHMQPSPKAKLTSLKIQSMWEQPWRLQMRSSRTLVHTNAQYQFHQINRIISWQLWRSKVGLFFYLSVCLHFSGSLLSSQKKMLDIHLSLHHRPYADNDQKALV